jgi:LysM repeat protein
MAVAFGAIIIARLSSGGDAGGGGSLVAAGTTATPVVTASPAAGGATSGPSADGEPIRTLVPTEVEPSDSPAPSVAESPAPSAVPSASPEPAERPTTYRVRRGDTLSGIAAEFGTTVAALAALNDISDPSRLRAGQVLKLPQD